MFKIPFSDSKPSILFGLSEIAHNIMLDFTKDLNWAKKFAVKKAVNRVRDRFEKDEIDEAAFQYIMTKLFKEFKVLEDSIPVLDLELSSEEREKADQILEGIQDKLNSKLVKTITRVHTKEALLSVFVSKIEMAGLDKSQAIELASALWAEVQNEF